MELIKAKSQPERTGLLAAKKELMTVELRKELVRQGNLLLVEGKYSPAFDIYLIVQDIAEQISDKEGVAAAALNIGTVYYFQGNYDLALKSYSKAEGLFKAVGNRAEAAKALFGLALVYQEQRRDTDALNSFERALQEFEALHDRHEMANTLSSIGTLHYSRGNYAAASKAFLETAKLGDGSAPMVNIANAFYMQGDYAQALDYYLKSLKQSEEQGNTAGIASSLGGAASCYYYLGNYESSVDYYRKSLAVAEKLSDKAGVAAQLQGIGNVYRALGDFGSALESYLKSFDLASQMNATIVMASALGNIGTVRAMQGDSVQAMESYGKSLAQFEAAGDKAGIARMLSSLGDISHMQKNYPLALDHYRKALALREVMADRTNSAHLLVGIGIVYLAQGNYTQARESFEKGIAIFESLNRKVDIADVLTKIADSYLLEGDNTKALDLAGRAVALARQAEISGTLWYALVQTGKAQRSLDRPAEASRAFAEAVMIVESMRAQPSAEREIKRDTLLPFRLAVEVLIDQSKPSEAFAYAERAKLQTLNEVMQGSNVKIKKNMTSQEQLEEAKLTGELVSLSNQLNRAEQSEHHDDARLVSLQSRLRLARTAYERFRNRLYARHPQLRIARGDVSPLAWAAAQALIGNQDTALLEYVVTEERTYLFVLTREQSQKVNASVRRSARKLVRPTVTLKVYPLNITNQDLAARVSAFCRLLARRDEAFQQPARELYDLLLKPAQQQLGGKTSLILVPDGILWGLPFEALQPADGQYLIEQTSTSYEPSLAVLREMRERRRELSRRRSTAPTLLAFGNPLLTKELADRVELTFKGKILEQVPEQEEEVKKLGTVYGETLARVYTGAKASEERAKAEENRFRVLHFAAHTILDDVSPIYSFIVLSPGNGSQGDGLLQALEIMKLHSQADLVVLSASALARGECGVGNAAMAFSWSWFVAGTPTAVLSRWEVQSAGRTQMMVDFHRRLMPKRESRFTDPRAEALRQSALTLRKSNEYQHPHYWSGFMLMGDGR